MTYIKKVAFKLPLLVGTYFQFTHKNQKSAIRNIYLRTITVFKMYKLNRELNFYLQNEYAMCSKCDSFQLRLCWISKSDTG